MIIGSMTEIGMVVMAPTRGRSGAKARVAKEKVKEKMVRARMVKGREIEIDAPVLLFGVASATPKTIPTRLRMSRAGDARYVKTIHAKAFATSVL